MKMAKNTWISIFQVYVEAGNTFRMMAMYFVQTQKMMYVGMENLQMDVTWNRVNKFSQQSNIKEFVLWSHLTLLNWTTYLFSGSNPQCELNDNKYYSYGDYRTINDVSGPNACCKLCKEDPNCMNFSYGKLKDGGYSKQCYLKRGGTLSSRHEFISSPQNIADCSCGKGKLRVCQWKVVKFKFCTCKALYYGNIY